MDAADFRALPERLQEKICPEPSGCWLWIGPARNGGYGWVYWQRRNAWLAHKLVYELLVGPLPEGRELHHKCRERRCCNPEHLQVVTHSEHSRIEPRRTKQSSCQKGHTYGTDPYVHNGKKYCRICRMEYKRRWREKQHK